MGETLNNVGGGDGREQFLCSNRWEGRICGYQCYLAGRLVNVWRSLLMGKSEEGERLSHRTEGDLVH